MHSFQGSMETYAKRMKSSPSGLDDYKSDALKQTEATAITSALGSADNHKQIDQRRLARRITPQVIS